ncbi:MAG: hypothetical protein ACRDQE_08320 [Gaiellales bacterium]
MATRKQQRRKYQRAVAHARSHEGDDGADQREVKPDKKQAARSPRGTPMVPSARRTAKRAVIFATLFYLVITFTGGGVSPAVKLANTAVMFILFWSMGWMVESFVWRRHQKKQGGPAA